MSNFIDPADLISDLNSYISTGDTSFLGATSDEYWNVTGSVTLDAAQFKAAVATFGNFLMVPYTTATLSDTADNLLSIFTQPQDDANLKGVDALSISNITWLGERPLVDADDEAILGENNILFSPADPGATIDYDDLIAQETAGTAESANFTLADKAANIARLTPAQILAAPATLTQIEVTDSFVEFNLAQAEALAKMSIRVVGPNGDDNSVYDPNPSFDDLSVSQQNAFNFVGLNLTSTLFPINIDAPTLLAFLDDYISHGTDNFLNVAYDFTGSLTLSVVQYQTLQTLISGLVDDEGMTLTIDDSPANLEALTLDQINRLGAFDVSALSSSGYRPQFTLTQAASLYANHIALTPHLENNYVGADALKNPADFPSNAQNVIIRDVAYNIETLTVDQILEAPAGVVEIQSEDDSVLLSLAKAEALAQAGIMITVPTDDTVTVYDPNNQWAQLTTLQQEWIKFYGVDQVVTKVAPQSIDAQTLVHDLDDYIQNGDDDFYKLSYTLTGSATLTAAQFDALTKLIETFSVADDQVKITITDTAADIATLSTSDISLFKDDSVAAVNWSDGRPTFDLAQVVALEQQVLSGVKLTDVPGVALPVSEIGIYTNAQIVFELLGVNSVSVSDTAANIQSLSPDAIRGLISSISEIDADDASVYLSVAQAEALEDAAIKIVAPKDDFVAVVDTASALQGMSADQLEALGYIGVTEVAAKGTSPAVFNDDQMTTLANESIAVVTPPDNPGQDDGVITIHSDHAGGPTFVLELNPSVASASAAYMEWIHAGVQMLADSLDNDITINISLGYGEYSEGQPGLPPGISEGGAWNPRQSYDDIVAYLKQNATTAAQAEAYNHLPSSLPAGLDDELHIGTAELKALGVLAADDSALDGWVGMGVGWSQEAEIAGVLHEVTHAMGRMAGSTVLGLFDYYTSSLGSSPVNNFKGDAPGPASYFSIDGGATRLADFGDNTDAGDFLNSSSLSVDDAFNEDVGNFKYYELSPLDLLELNVLGFKIDPTQNMYASDIEAFTDGDIQMLASVGVTTLDARGALISSDEWDQASVTLSRAEVGELAAAGITVSDAGARVSYIDTASALEGLAADDLQTLSGVGVDQLIASDASLIVSLDWFNQHSGQFTFAAETGFVDLQATAAQIGGLSDATLAQMAGAGVTRLEATDGTVTLNLSQVNQMNGQIGVIADQGGVVVCAMAASDFAGLTSGELAALSNVGVTKLVIDGSAVIDASLAGGLASGGFSVSAPPGATVTLADAGDAIAGLSAQQFALLPQIGVTKITAQALIWSLNVAQSQALGRTGIPIAPPPQSQWQTGVVIYDTGADFAALTPAEIAALPGASLDNKPFLISSTALTLSLAQALAYADYSGGSFTLATESAGQNLTPLEVNLVSVPCSAADFEALTPAQLATLDAASLNYKYGWTLTLSSGAITLDAAQAGALGNAVTLLGANASVTPAITVVDSAANFEALTSAQLNALSSAVVAFSVTDSALTLSVAELSTFFYRALQLAPGASFTIADTAANIKAWLDASGSWPEYLYSDYGLRAIAVTDGPITLNVAEVLTLQNAVVDSLDPIALTTTNGATVTLADTAAQIEAMSAGQLAALSSNGVSQIDVTDGSLTLSVAQAVALLDPIHVSVPAGDSVSVVDSEAALDGLTPDQLQMLTSLGVTTFETTSLTGAAPLTIAAGETLLIDGAAAAAQTIAFAAGSGTLAIADAADFQASVLRFQPGATLDLTKAAYDPSATATLGAGNVLTIAEASGTYTIQLDPLQDFADFGAVFTPGPDSGGGTAVTLQLQPIASDFGALPSGDNAAGLSIVDDGVIDIGGGATVYDATVVTGGQISVEGAAYGVTLAGGQMSLSGYAQGVVVEAGGQFDDYGVAVSTVVESGGTVVVHGAINLDVAGATGGAIVLNDAGASVTFDQSGSPAVSLEGVQAGDAIDLSAVAFTGGQPTLGADNVLRFAEGGVNYALTLDAGAQDAAFFAQADASGLGTQIVVTDIVACFVRGARIRTPRGDVAIETLRVGDEVVTAAGATRPIRWTGLRRLDLRRHRDPGKVQPILVRRGAFGDGLPVRDLRLSPGHNIVWAGVLMPISALVNGASIVRCEVDKVEYHHIELDAHDILFAEGLPNESYLDCGNRAAFEGGAAYIEAHPDWRPKHWRDACLPVVTEGPQVVAARRHLSAQLLEQGIRVVDDADAHVIADGVRIDPVRLGADRMLFVLREGCLSIQLRTRTFIPAHTCLDNPDPRELGLCVARLQIDGDDIALDDDRFSATDWHDVERLETSCVWRWTRGAVALPTGARLVVVETAGRGYYRQDAGAWPASGRCAARR